MIRLYVAMLPYWQKAKQRLGGDAGTVSNETAWVTGLLIAGATVIVGAIVAWGVSQANSIDVGPGAP